MSRTANRIRQEAAEADAQLAALAAQTATPTVVDAPAEAPANEIPPAPAPAENGATPIDPPKSTETKATDMDAAYKELEQKFRSLQGMFNRQSSDFDTIKRQHDAALRTIEELKASVATPKAEPTKTQPASVSQKDIEEYGQELIDLIRRVATEVSSNQSQVLSMRLSNIEKSLNTVKTTAAQAAETAAVTAEDRFFAKLTEKVADWEVINTDPRFLDWLNEADVFSGVVRNKLLQQAYAAMDVERTAKFFLAYKAETGKSAPASDGAKSDSAKVNLNTLASPGNAAAANPNPNGNRGKRWTTAEVEKVYDDYTRGRISRADFEKKEAEIKTALAEGRIA